MPDDSINEITPLYFGDEPQIPIENSNEKSLLFGDESINKVIYDEADSPLLFGDTNENSDSFYPERMQEIPMNKSSFEETIEVSKELRKRNEDLLREKNYQLKTQIKNYQRKVKSRRVLAISVVSLAFATGLFTGFNQKENYDKFKEQIKTRIETTDENGLPKLSFLKAYAKEHSEIQIDGLWYKLDYVIECAEKGEKLNPMYSYNEMNKSNEISDQYAEEYKEANGYYPNGYSQ